MPLSERERIGNRRNLKIKTEYEDLGYSVISNPYNTSGIDLIIVATDKAKIVEVLELTNYRDKKWTIVDKTFQRYLRDLSWFGRFLNVKRTLVVSFLENLTIRQITLLRKNGILIRIEGKQD